MLSSMPRPVKRRIARSQGTADGEAGLVRGPGGADNARAARCGIAPLRTVSRARPQHEAGARLPETVLWEGCMVISTPGAPIGGRSFDDLVQPDRVHRL